MAKNTRNRRFCYTCKKYIEGNKKDFFKSGHSNEKVKTFRKTPRTLL